MVFEISPESVLGLTPEWIHSCDTVPGRACA
jgi:hypothetical protein